MSAAIPIAQMSQNEPPKAGHNGITDQMWNTFGQLTPPFSSRPTNRLTRVIVLGDDRDINIVQHLLFVLSYFMRSGQVFLRDESPDEYPKMDAAKVDSHLVEGTVKTITEESDGTASESTLTMTPCPKSSEWRVRNTASVAYNLFGGFSRYGYSSDFALLGFQPTHSLDHADDLPYTFLPQLYDDLRRSINFSLLNTPLLSCSCVVIDTLR